jgi:YHS domain-containing protein
MKRDQVCGMDVDERTAAAKTEYAGDTYYFCSVACRDKFEADPERYVSRTDASQS